MLMRHCNCSPRPTWHQQQQSQKNRQCAQQLPGRATAPRLHGKWSRRARRPKSWAGRTNDAHAPLAAPVRACPAGCSGHSNAAQPPGARPAPRYSAYPRLRDATVRLLGRGWMRGLSRSTYRGHADNPSIKIVDRATPAHTPPSHPCQSCPGPPPPCSRKERGNLALRTKARGLIALIEAHREKGTLPSLLALL